MGMGRHGAAPHREFLIYSMAYRGDIMGGDFEGKVVAISGGTKGIGAAVALECARRGADVAIGGRDEKSALGLIARMERDYGRRGLFAATDLRDVAGCRRLIDGAVERFGRLDGFVNYAGILPAATLEETDEGFFDDMFAINMKAPFFCAKHAVAAMKQSGGGSLVFVGSAHAYGGSDDRAAYACSKGALLTLVRHIAKNYAKDRIRANWITMGWVATQGEMALRTEQGRDLRWLEETAAASVPMGRLLTVEDHVPGIMYFLSDSSSMVTGTELQINGGFVP
jgi:NAD(P)-dependent dehydrogenase (short-subunit alcohol dehydrogenase family)